MFSYQKLGLKAKYIIVVIVTLCCLLGNGCASSCIPDPNVYYGPRPDNYKQIALEHFVMHKGQWDIVKERFQLVPTIGLSFTPVKGCELSEEGEKVHGWKVSVPLYKLQVMGDVMSGYKTWGTVIIRDGKVVWCDCEK